jgi:hypothetical protein
MNNYLTRAQIDKRFQSEWVLLGAPKTNKKLEVLGGEVLCHSKDRAEVHRAAKELRPKRSAVLYIGRIPEGTVIIL